MGPLLRYPGTSLSPPRPAPPAPKCGTPREKSSAVAQERQAQLRSTRPAGVSSRCCRRSACQVPSRAGVRGAGPAQVEARLPAESAPSRLPRPHEHAQSAAVWGSEQWRGEGAGAKGWVALPGEEWGGGSSRKGRSASAVSCGLLKSSINHINNNKL